jgi:hypothetical protein
MCSRNNNEPGYRHVSQFLKHATHSGPRSHDCAYSSWRIFLRNFESIFTENEGRTSNGSLQADGCEKRTNLCTRMSFNRDGEQYLYRTVGICFTICTSARAAFLPWESCPRLKAA